MDGPFDGPLMTRQMLRSRIDFISSIRHTRRAPLMKRFGGINWEAAMKRAEERGWVVLRKTLRPVTRQVKERAEPSPS
jgi:hypothetical protein